MSTRESVLVFIVGLLCCLCYHISFSCKVTSVERGQEADNFRNSDDKGNKVSRTKLSRNENREALLKHFDNEHSIKNSLVADLNEKIENDYPLKDGQRKKGKHHLHERTRKLLHQKLTSLVNNRKDKKLCDSIHNNDVPSSLKIENDKDLGKNRSDRTKNSKYHHKVQDKITHDKDTKTGKTLNKIDENFIKNKSEKTNEGKEYHKDIKTTKNKEKHGIGGSKLLSGKKLVSLYEVLLVHPFKTWKFKDRYNSMADIGIHESLLHEVVGNKWNSRLKHKLFKVFKGENIHLAVIGGSNSAGGGLQEDEGKTDGLFFRVISDWWRKTITPVTGSHLKIRPIAMGGTASDFFQYCHRVYVQQNVDLVFLEMSVNDLHELPYNVNLSLPIEQLTRQLLEYPTKPALIYVNFINGRSYYQGCTNLEDFGQKLLSDTYNVTTFSWRDAVCPVIDGKYRVPIKGCSVICKDGHHVNQLGHAQISLMMINLFRDLLLSSIDHVGEFSKQVFHDEQVLPKPVFIAKESKVITNPLCWTTVTPNFKRKIIKNGMEVGVMENYGFDYLHDKAIGGHCASRNACRADTYSGWTGKDVGARLTLSFTVPPLGHKRAVQTRSVVFATRTCWTCGVAEVWLDDDYVNRRLVRARSQYGQTLSEIIALRVNAGDHTMNIKLVQPGSLTVVGVMLGPPDGPY